MENDSNELIVNFNNYIQLNILIQPHESTCIYLLPQLDIYTHSLQNIHEHSLQRDTHSLQKGDSHSLQRVDTYSLQKGDSHSLQKGDTHSLQRVDTYSWQNAVKELGNGYLNGVCKCHESHSHRSEKGELYLYVHNYSMNSMALKSFEKLNSLGETKHQTWNNKIITLYLQGLFKELVEFYNYSIADNIKFTISKLLYAISLEKLGYMEDAKIAFEIAFKHFQEKIEFMSQILTKYQHKKINFYLNNEDELFVVDSNIICDSTFHKTQHINNISKHAKSDMLGEIKEKFANQLINRNDLHLKIRRHNSYSKVSKATYFNAKVAIKKLGSVPIPHLYVLIEEIEKINKLKHPNFVQCLGICIDDDPLIVMEYVKGINLYHYLKSNLASMNEKEKLTIAIQAVTSIYFIHSRNIIHGNVNCSSYIVEIEYGYNDKKIVTLKLIGTGISKIERFNNYDLGYNKEKLIKNSKKPFPENVNEKNWTKETDVYCLGMLIYEIYCDEAPFDKENKCYLKTHPKMKMPDTVNEKIIELINSTTNEHPIERLTVKNLLIQLKELKPNIQQQSLQHSPNTNRKI